MKKLLILLIPLLLLTGCQREVTSTETFIDKFNTYEGYEVSYFSKENIEDTHLQNGAYAKNKSAIFQFYDLSSDNDAKSFYNLFIDNYDDNATKNTIKDSNNLLITKFEGDSYNGIISKKGKTCIYVEYNKNKESQVIEILKDIKYYEE